MFRFGEGVVGEEGWRAWLINHGISRWLRDVGSELQCWGQEKFRHIYWEVKKARKGLKRVEFSGGDGREIREVQEVLEEWLGRQEEY